ncbi:pentatricopeptide repeat-containing protein At1g74630-like [Mangifera indica]|uniref:pentatricopeptide repeat-containing protein At1g74630-like n=1 Tax=Mangifera indica TaxID=29780 RepID=UPI001CF9B8FE|nr:pentatricopeptide repeat-containing protein At1g74630-like [Mangifera indica]
MNNTYHQCLSLLNHCKTLKAVKQVHASLLKTALDLDAFFAGKLLLHCAVTISDSLDYARRLFFHFPNPDVFMYNALVRGFSESDKPQNSITAFIELRRKCLDPPDSFSFAFVLKAAANLRSLKSGIQLHCQALVHGLDGHLFVGTTLISMYGECGFSNFSMKVFDEMRDPNVVVWNAVVTACFRSGDVENAKRMFDTMPFWNLTSWNVMLAGYMKAGELELARNVFIAIEVKDDVSWSTMIVGLAQNGCFDEAFGLFRELLQVGTRPNEVSLTGVLSACAQAGAFEFGRILHGFVEKFGFNRIVSVNNALIDTYSKCGNVGMARLVLERMPEDKSVVSWTSMIAGLAMHGHGEEAIQLFHEMEESGVRPDGITFISILYACSHAGLIEQGSRYFSLMKDVYCLEPTIEHYGCMVDLYGRAGKLEKAYEFACQMPISPNTIIWRTLLGACGIHGNVELAEQVKERLSVLDPNNSGDHVLLSNIYAVAGKWKEQVTIRRSMTDQRLKKTPGWSMIEVDKIMYSFVAGGKPNKITEEAYEKLRVITYRLRVEGGYVPEVGSVLHDIEEEEKEDSVSKHSEKLALAFGIARMCKGKAIRIVKNLRICRDCHTVMKLSSKVYGLEIVVRDRSRFHSFMNGSCSCRDYW